jgi:serralysin
MAMQDNSIAGSGYGNAYIDSLIWGCRWTGGSITVGFGTGINSYNYFGYAWEPHEIAAFERAFAAFEAVCNVDFVVTTDTADMMLWSVDNADIGAGVAGMFDVPDETYPQTDGNFNWEYESWSFLNAGGDGYQTIIHELGHGLGLAHPHDGGDQADATLFPGVSDSDDAGKNGLNQGIWTMMSYITDWDSDEPSTTFAYGHGATPMAFDIAALQILYGANMSYRTGNDTYALPDTNAQGTGWACLWDAGGNDTISAATARSQTVIDLRDAPLVGPDAGGYVSWTPGIKGGFTIAANAVMENAIGSNFADTILGNSVANDLQGRGGGDRLQGFAGDDRISGGEGRDQLIGGLGSDTMTGGNSADDFIFATSIRLGDVDEITDFNRVGDEIWLDGTLFRGIGQGRLDNDAFVANRSGQARDGEDRIIYDRTSGELYYDKDGRGGSDRILFAELDSRLALNHADFVGFI